MVRLQWPCGTPPLRRIVYWERETQGTRTEYLECRHILEVPYRPGDGPQMPERRRCHACLKKEPPELTQAQLDDLARL